ncbi:MAG: hypothetical protein J7L23_03255 [Candidatus Diapherotrites archaeon]|nr:hypothetical protein [Candidatus Diapherotrites archaeon]
MLNERGQAFDAFKLLIAAVVAAAILAVIYAIIIQVQPPFQQAAQTITKGISSENIAGAGSYYGDGKVKFNKGRVLSSSGLAGAVGINEKNVCFCTSTNPPECPSDSIFTEPDFTVTGTCGNGQTLKANEEVYGNVWIYRNNDNRYMIGFQKS